MDTQNSSYQAMDRTHKKLRTETAEPAPDVTPLHWTSDLSVPPTMSPTREMWEAPQQPVHMFASKTSMNDTLRLLHQERVRRRQEPVQQQHVEQIDRPDKFHKRKQSIPLTVRTSKRHCPQGFRSIEHQQHPSANGFHPAELGEQKDDMEQ